MANAGFRSLLAYWIGGVGKSSITEFEEYYKLSNPVIIANYYPIISTKSINYNYSMNNIASSIIFQSYIQDIPDHVITSGKMIIISDYPITSYKKPI